MREMNRAQLIGRHTVTDPGICHGKPTFRGARVLVSDVLEQVASGKPWETIVGEWNGRITAEAIREGVRLASQALLKHVTNGDGNTSNGSRSLILYT